MTTATPLAAQDEDGWYSLREIDRQTGHAKGSAFRCFKALEAGLMEARDYRVLDAHRDRAQIERLRASQRIYASSVQVLLLSAPTAARIRERLRSMPGAVLADADPRTDTPQR